VTRAEIGVIALAGIVAFGPATWQIASGFPQPNPPRVLVIDTYIPRHPEGWFNPHYWTEPLGDYMDSIIDAQRMWHDGKHSYSSRDLMGRRISASRALSAFQGPAKALARAYVRILLSASAGRYLSSAGPSLFW
jgi:hypothetical protein